MEGAAPPVLGGVGLEDEGHYSVGLWWVPGPPDLGQRWRCPEKLNLFERFVAYLYFGMRMPPLNLV